MSDAIFTEKKCSIKRLNSTNIRFNFQITFISKMAKCLQEEEKLAVCVQGYPVLYNMAEPSFLNKSEKQNACGEIPDELQLGSWKEEKLAFTSLRSNYNRHKKTATVLEHALAEYKRLKRT